MSSPEISRDAVQTFNNIARTLGLTFTTEQMEALLVCFELGADPDAVLRYLSEHSSPTVAVNRLPSSHNGTPIASSQLQPRLRTTSQPLSAPPPHPTRIERFPRN